MTANKTLTTQQRSRLAQTELTKLADAFCRALVKLKREVKRSAAQSAGGAASRYLELTDAKHQVEQLGHIAQRLLIEDERQDKLLGGAFMRASSALTYLNSQAGDAFERAQVLVQAATDLAARLSERGLLLPELPREAAYQPQEVAQSAALADISLAEFRCAA